MIRIVTILLFVAGGLASPLKHAGLNSIRGTNCQSCHPVDPDKINVHLIPHSHDDVGWLKTYEQYYFGQRNDIQDANVEHIISTTVEALKANRDRRFVQVETAYLWKWWQYQTKRTQHDFIKLVNNGQIEIVNAAWSMNDEANVNYQSVIDQFTWGLRFINDTLGKCGVPRIGWQIDPFGHSREHASILTKLGFDGLFFARLDFQDKQQRIKEKNLEMLWKSSASLNNSHLFTSIFADFYSAPSGFCFDIECNDEEIDDSNAERRVSEFTEDILKWSKYYRTSNLLIPMGGDFQFQKAEKNFINIDRLISAFKKYSNISVIYSTPSCYIKAVNDEANQKHIKFAEKTDDFFPYGSNAHNYWTGYFTSRPNAKRFERISNNVLQAAKQLTAFNKILYYDDLDSSLTPLRRALGILQHHDAITGTAKQHVAKDYARLLSEGIQTAEPSLVTIMNNFLKLKPNGSATLDLQTCLQSNISICDPTSSELEQFVVSVYNPLARESTHFVRLPVPDGDYKITGPDGVVDYDLVDSITDFSYLKEFGLKPQPKELVFVAAELPPLGVKLYYIERSGDNQRIKQSKKSCSNNQRKPFSIDRNTGGLSRISMKDDNLVIEQQFKYYEGANDVCQASGAYIFRPKGNQSFPFDQSKINYTTFSGNIVSEERQVYNDWITQIVRTYNADDSFIEFEWIIGPIEVDEDNRIGKEIVSSFRIGPFNNSNTFYTDSNGREMIERHLNKRNDYKYDSASEPIASNYYPITSRIVANDESQELRVSILTDRAEGGTSLHPDEIELMVHRRLLVDDCKGVDEPLNDTEYDRGEIVRGQHRIVVGSPSDVQLERELALRQLLPPIVMVSSTELTLEDVQAEFHFTWSGLKQSLPENVHLLTFETWKDDSYLIRLEHLFEKDEDRILSEPVIVQLDQIFVGFDIVSVRETTLAANQWLDEYEKEPKYEWNIERGGRVNYEKQQASDDFNIELQPMQIRTFIVNVCKKTK